jgi:hypothetical protein
MPSPAEIQAKYDQRDADIFALKNKGEVTAADLKALDRLGRFRVADEMWHLCTEGAKISLLNDEHPHVKSCAVLAQSAKSFAQWYLENNEVPDDVEIFETFEADGEARYVWPQVQQGYVEWLSLQGK